MIQDVPTLSSNYRPNTRKMNIDGELPPKSPEVLKYSSTSGSVTYDVISREFQDCHSTNYLTSSAS